MVNALHLKLLAPFGCLAHTPQCSSDQSIVTFPAGYHHSQVRWDWKPYIITSWCILNYLKSYPIHLPFQLQVLHKRHFSNPCSAISQTKALLTGLEALLQWFKLLFHLDSNIASLPYPEPMPFQCLVSMFLGTLQLQGLWSLGPGPQRTTELKPNQKVLCQPPPLEVFVPLMRFLRAPANSSLMALCAS